jgi:hypothetical protein
MRRVRAGLGIVSHLVLIYIDINIDDALLIFLGKLLVKCGYSMLGL